MCLKKNWLFQAAEWQDMVEENLNYHEQTGQKRKYPSSEEQPDQYDSKEFLEKSTGELLDGGNSGSSIIKKSIIVDLSDDDDDDNDDDEVIAP